MGALRVRGGGEGGEAGGKHIWILELGNSVYGAAWKFT